ncbi:MAG: HD domain-containing protein [Clostridium perfringens]|nr:HD domain-containing protein [Clostridium perfringens]
MIYRIKQFMWAINCNFKKIDYDYICKFLNNEEINLFNKLKHSDKHHCVRVCIDCLKIREGKRIDIDKEILGKVALLHDIGKIQYRLSLVEKVALVILHQISRGNLSKLDKIKAVNIYYNHGVRGRELLEKSNGEYNHIFLSAIENHHNNFVNNNSIHNNQLLRILVEADNNN